MTHNGIAPRDFTAPEPAGGAQAGGATVHAPPAASNSTQLAQSGIGMEKRIARAVVFTLNATVRAELFETISRLNISQRAFIKRAIANELLREGVASFPELEAMRSPPRLPFMRREQ